MAAQEYNDLLSSEVDWENFPLPGASDMTRSPSDDSAYYSQHGSIDTPTAGPSEYVYSQYPAYNMIPEDTSMQSGWSQSSWVYDTTMYNPGLDYTTDPSPVSEVYSPPSDNPLRFESHKKEYTCLHFGCNQKPFGRSADLDRHYKQVHTPPHQKEAFYCDYKNCSRSTKGKEAVPSAFHRKDHFRDHLRDFHHEDLPKRGPKDSGSAWLVDRWVKPEWWRCGKCLKRVWVHKRGWECPDCKIYCEKERQLIREGATARPPAGHQRH